MPTPLIYAATDLAVRFAPTKPLAGNRNAAQRYVDTITRSDWWKSTAPGFDDYQDPPPDRVWIWEAADNNIGGQLLLDTVTQIHGKLIPSIELGQGKVHGGIPAIADKWVILHELAHVMTTGLPPGDGHHGPKFVYAFHSLVKYKLGNDSAAALKAACKVKKIRLNYRLL